MAWLQTERDLDRCLRLLTLFSLERTGWKRWVLGRWYHHHEPLRNDAANIVRASIMNPIIPNDSQLVGDVKKEPD